MAVKVFGHGNTVKMGQKGANGAFANLSLRSGMPEKGRIRAITMRMGREGTGNPPVWGMIWDGPSGAILAQSDPRDITTTVSGYAGMVDYRFEFPSKPTIDAYRDIRIGYSKVSNVANQYLWYGLTCYPTGTEAGYWIDYTAGVTQTSPGLMQNVTVIAATGLYVIVEYETGGQIKVFGSSFVAKPLKVWNGAAWLAKPLKIWNGSSWNESNS